jgi:hypothetical protein
MPAAPATRRTWVVRKGDTGDGPDLFCVYAATMEAARSSASDSLDVVDAQVAFTVHALADGQELPADLTLARNLFSDVFTALAAA